MVTRIKPELVKVLKFIYETLEKNNIEWVLIGSLSLALQNVDIGSHDIDILTTRADSYRINEILKQYEVHKVEFKETARVSSYFSTYIIDNIKIEVMGDYKENRRGEWVSFSERLKKKSYVSLENIIIPVSALKEQLASYELSKREKDALKAGKIRKALSTNNVSA